MLPTFSSPSYEQPHSRWDIFSRTYPQETSNAAYMTSNRCDRSVWSWLLSHNSHLKYHFTDWLAKLSGWLTWSAQQLCKTSNSAFFHFVTIHTFDRQTDDRHLSRDIVLVMARYIVSYQISRYWGRIVAYPYCYNYPSKNRYSAQL